MMFSSAMRSATLSTSHILLALSSKFAYGTASKSAPATFSFTEVVAVDMLGRFVEVSSAVSSPWSEEVAEEDVSLDSS